MPTASSPPDEATSDRPDRPDCPSCATKGKPVGAVTLDSLLTEARRSEGAGTDHFRFCRTRDCDVVWYRPEGGVAYGLSDVSVRVGQKETSADRPVCYCFDFTAADVQDEVRRTGASGILDGIVDKCRLGLDRCEQTNPQGTCCLGDVRRVMKQAQLAPSADAVIDPSDTRGGRDGATVR